jgi:5'-3' exonuclease
LAVESGIATSMPPPSSAPDRLAAVAEGLTVHLVDGTFELFRCFHGAPRAQNAAGREVGAVRGLLATMTALVLDPVVTNIAVAFDSVVSPPASSRRASDEDLIESQVSLAADVVRALGVTLWPSGRYQADEIIATAAARFTEDERVAQIVICATDNDFNQCVRGDRVVVLDRIRRVITDEAAVRARYGVAPAQIPDLFALVGDRSDGLPGVPGWGVRSAAGLLARYGCIEAIPSDPTEWDVVVRGATRLAAALADHREEALLCRDLAVLRTDLPLRHSVDDLKWKGARRAAIETLCATIGDGSVIARIDAWSE